MSRRVLVLAFGLTLSAVTPGVAGELAQAPRISKPGPAPLTSAVDSGCVCAGSVLKFVTIEKPCHLHLGTA